ncbi:MAG: hypothetical protein K0U66_01595 [Gammaproteobacteria bacterium]|nr:hypothetical protein [Gammaproteobacteria bacterium]
MPLRPTHRPLLGSTDASVCLVRRRSGSTGVTAYLMLRLLLVSLDAPVGLRHRRRLGSIGVPDCATLLSWLGMVYLTNLYFLQRLCTGATIAIII